MLSKVYKSAWLPVFGQSFILVEAENCGSAGRFGTVVIVNFHADRKQTTVTHFPVSAQLPEDLFNDEAVLEDMARMAKDTVRNQVYELGAKASLQQLMYIPDLPFSESDACGFLFNIIFYQAFDILKNVRFRPGGEFERRFSSLPTKRERWSITTQ